MIAGLVKPTSGYIEVNGRTLFDSAKNIDIPPDKRNIGYVFQDSRLFPHMTVRQNLLYGANKQKNDLANIASLLGIADLLSRYPDKLSGGEKQRVAIGRALLSEPKLLLMDEPMASLDAGRRDELLQYISIIPKELGIPVIYITHAMDEIMRLANKVGLMTAGRLELFGSALTVLNSDQALAKLPDRDFGFVWEGTMLESSAETGLGVVDFGGGQIDVASGLIPQGTRVRFRIPAMDVVLSTTPTRTVARNLFAGRITSTVHHDYFVDVYLDISGVPLCARITKQSFGEMGKRLGDTLYATVKSVVASSQFYVI
jgi:molybdate transport system ATP-binding protein